MSVSNYNRTSQKKDAKKIKDIEKMSKKLINQQVRVSVTFSFYFVGNHEPFTKLLEQLFWL